MAETQIASFDAARKHGFRLTAADRRCYSDAQATSKEMAGNPPSG